AGRSREHRVAESGPFLRRGGAGDAAHPGGSRPHPQLPEARRRGATSLARRGDDVGRGPRGWIDRARRRVAGAGQDGRTQKLRRRTALFRRPEPGGDGGGARRLDPYRDARLEHSEGLVDEGDKSKVESRKWKVFPLSTFHFLLFTFYFSPFTFYFPLLLTRCVVSYAAEPPEHRDATSSGLAGV